MNSSWNKHYLREKSQLFYPDENLIRIAKSQYKNIEQNNNHFAVDLGCGTGRHLGLLQDIGFKNIYGLDISLNGLKKAKNHFSSPVVQSNNTAIPIKENNIDFLIAWGSLHYNLKTDLALMLKEIHRVLKKGGIFAATLRSVNDSYLKQGKNIGNNQWQTNLNDINGALVSFYSEIEINEYLSIFKNFSYGLIERTIMGDLSKKISHWIIKAEK